MSSEWPDGHRILVSDGRIRDVDSPDFAGAEVVDLGGMHLLPGFIDLHLHGAVSVDVNTADCDGLMKIGEFLARHGVTAWVPTLVPDSDESYRRIIGEIDKLMKIQQGRPLAQAVGVHYEGVFANEKMCGALRPEFFRRFTGTEGSALPRLKRGVHMTTIAPEIEGGIELVGELVKEGWIVSIGHSKADTAILDKAFDAGARHCTHFFNAMTGLHHRDVGVVGWALTSGDVTFDIIADGIHVHPKILEFACRAKTPDKVSLISDSVAPAGLGDGEYKIWGETVSVENGRTKNERGTIAGSVITMLDAVNRMLSLGFSMPEVSKMASLNPAKLLGIDKSHGSIEVGKRGDLIALNEDGKVKMTMIGGKIAFNDS